MNIKSRSTYRVNRDWLKALRDGKECGLVKTHHSRPIAIVIPVYTLQEVENIAEMHRLFTDNELTTTDALRIVQTAITNHFAD